MHTTTPIFRSFRRGGGRNTSRPVRLQALAVSLAMVLPALPAFGGPGATGSMFSAPVVGSPMLVGAVRSKKRRSSKKDFTRPPRGAPRSIPFQPGERLTYDITWLGVHVGTAVLEVAPATRHRRRPAWRFRMRAKTNKYADAIYKVRDDMHSWTDARVRRSVHFRKKQREGSYHRDVVLHFNHRRKQIRYQNQWRKYPPRKLYKDSYDPLALIYGFRAKKVRKKGNMEMSATDGLKTIRANVKVHGRETITVGDVTYRCWKVEPELKDVGGIFKRSKNARMLAWFSDDDHRVPVRLESEVLVGSFVATLVKIEGAK